MTNLRANPDGARLRFFTSNEVAGMLKMNAQVITRKLQAGELEGYKLGRDWRVSESQLMNFLERHRGPIGPRGSQGYRGRAMKGVPAQAVLRKKALTTRLSSRS